jgi:hypothetical protein
MVDSTTPPLPVPDVPLEAEEDDKSEDEVDEDPPADEPDLQPEVRNSAQLLAQSS